MAMTKEQRKAQKSAKMKAYWEARRAAQTKDIEFSDETTIAEPIPDLTVTHPEAQQETMQEEPNVSDLIKQIQELKDMQWKLMSQQVNGTNQTAQVGVNGMTGTVDKYDMTEGIYPNPTARLAQEPKLQRFAFPINYELEFRVSETSYTTIDNIRMREPKFQLELQRVVLDEDSGDPTDDRWLVARLTMHEDPDTALVLARENGVDVEAQDEAAFLNEMRYLRMRDWLLNCFYPPKANEKIERKQTVIEGRLVEYWTKNTEGNTGITKEQWDKTPRIKF